MQNELINLEVINDYINKNKISKQEFCRRCGFCYAVLNKIYKGNNHVRLNAIFKIIKVIGKEESKKLLKKVEY